VALHVQAQWTILIVEDEALIAIELVEAFRKVGAFTTTTNTLKQASILVEHDSLAVAILDHALGDGDSTRLCERLNARGIPFVIYSGFNKVEGACKAGPLVRKPATGDVVVATAEGLLSSKNQLRIVSWGLRAPRLSACTAPEPLRVMLGGVGDGVHGFDARLIP
jgi:DNA-binding response OmpR family regulator